MKKIWVVNIIIATVIAARGFEIDSRVRMKMVKIIIIKLLRPTIEAMLNFDSNEEVTMLNFLLFIKVLGIEV